ncbi:hypothetical protein BFN03_13635 [Rhodococcus sp. WMMA185]|uniref:hypothetical protein n=1 Tax=Rhodococcus sp. WMMA185 TaxID=679318 RepID=UPI0008783EE1|nr:hypothetical protein [Rhodococcus sp. WMMA185]AOW94971.1 hypothetical protein BFN03_13635 [Rhodococcus sp. WMMA185]
MSAPARTPRRERVVLAQRRGARILRTRVEVEEQTEVGDAMIRGLVRTQLGLAIRLALLTVCLLCSVPLVVFLFPALSDVSVLGVRLPWVVLGVLVYPVLLTTGWIYVRQAERNEHQFADLVDD